MNCTVNLDGKNIALLFPIIKCTPRINHLPYQPGAVMKTAYPTTYVNPLWMDQSNNGAANLINNPNLYIPVSTKYKIFARPVSDLMRVYFSAFNLIPEPGSLEFTAITTSPFTPSVATLQSISKSHTDTTTEDIKVICELAENALLQMLTDKCPSIEDFSNSYWVILNPIIIQK